jgi:hypothetical protein
MPTPFEDLEQHLIDYLGAELGRIIEAIKNEDFLVKLPDEADMDKSPYEVAALIARTSNVYEQAARMAGIARAHAKLSKGRYDRKFKTSKIGKSEAERERAAMEAATEEHLKLALSESVAELADSLEAGARVASESIRRMALSNKAYYAAATQDGGAYRDDR